MDDSFFVEGEINNITACSSRENVWILNGVHLLRYSKLDSKSEYVLSLPSSFFRKKGFGFSMHYSAGKILIISEETSDVAIIDERTYESIEINVIEDSVCGKGLNYFPTYKKDIIYVFPKFGQKMAMVDNRGYTTIFNTWKEELESESCLDEKVEKIKAYSCYIDEKDGYFVALSNSWQYLVRFDYGMRLSKVMRVSREEKIIRNVVSFDNYIWLDIVEKGVPYILKVDKDGSILRRHELPEETSEKTFVFVKDERIYLTDLKKWFGYLNPEDGKVTCIFSLQNERPIIGINEELGEIIAIDVKYWYLLTVESGKMIMKRRHYLPFDVEGFVVNISDNKVEMQE